MKHLALVVKSVVIGVVVVGTLLLGLGGVAGAASSPTVPKHGRHVNCARATKALGRLEKTQAQIAAGLPKLAAAAGKAAAAGNTKRADRIRNRMGQFESAQYKARLAKRVAAIEARCPAAAPGTPSG
jgi:hypothetical protein